MPAAWASNDAEVVIALTAHNLFIAEEVLAVKLRQDATAVSAADLNGRAVRFALTKA